MKNSNDEYLNSESDDNFMLTLGNLMFYNHIDSDQISAIKLGTSNILRKSLEVSSNNSSFIIQKQTETLRGLDSDSDEYVSLNGCNFGGEPDVLNILPINKNKSK